VVHPGIEYLTQVENGAQQDGIVGGTQQISILLASKLENPVELSTPVTKITQDAEGVQVEGLCQGERPAILSSRFLFLL